MENVIEECLGRLWFDRLKRHKNLSIVALFEERNHSPACITLKQGLHQGALSVIQVEREDRYLKAEGNQQGRYPGTASRWFSSLLADPREDIFFDEIIKILSSRLPGGAGDALVFCQPVTARAFDISMFEVVLSL